MTLCFQLILATISLLQWLYAPDGLEVGFTIMAALTAGAGVLVHCLWKKRVAGQVYWLDPELMLIPGFLMVHFASPVFMVFGLEQSYSGELRPFGEYGSAALGAANAGLCSTFIGVMVGSRRSGISRQEGGRRRTSRVGAMHRSFTFNDEATSRTLQISALILSLIGLFSLAIFFLNYGNEYVGGAYQGVLAMDRNATVLLQLTKISIITGATVTVMVRQGGMMRKNWLNWIGTLPVAILMGLYAWHGDRGELVSALVPVLAAFYLNSRPSLMTVCVAIAIAFPVLGIIRAARNFNERGLAALVSAGSEQQFSESYQNTAGNLGFSGGLTCVAMALIDEKGVNGGYFLLQTLTGIIPFSSRVIGDYVRGSTFTESNPSDVLTMTVRGNLLSGTGTNTVASALLDLGVPGVFLVHFGFGWLIGNVSQRVKVGPVGPIFILAHCLTTGIATVVARYDVGILVKLLGYPLLGFAATASIISVLIFNKSIKLL